VSTSTRLRNRAYTPTHRRFGSIIGVASRARVEVDQATGVVATPAAGLATPLCGHQGDDRAAVDLQLLGVVGGWRDERPPEPVQVLKLVSPRRLAAGDVAPHRATRPREVDLPHRVSASPVAL